MLERREPPSCCKSMAFICEVAPLGPNPSAAAILPFPSVTPVPSPLMQNTCQIPKKGVEYPLSVCCSRSGKEDLMKKKVLHACEGSMQRMKLLNGLSEAARQRIQLSFPPSLLSHADAQTNSDFLILVPSLRNQMRDGDEVAESCRS